MRQHFIFLLIFSILIIGCASHLNVSREDFFTGDNDEEEYYFLLKDSTQIHSHKSEFYFQNDSLIIQGYKKVKKNSEWEYYEGILSINEIREIEFPRHSKTFTIVAQISCGVGIAAAGVLILYALIGGLGKIK